MTIRGTYYTNKELQGISSTRIILKTEEKQQ